MQITYESIERFIDNIAALFGDRCEIVVHDFTHGLDKTIVKIVNGHVSGRAVGGCPSSLFFDMYSEMNANAPDVPIHFNTEQGHILKSSTTLIRDSKGKVVGAICVNFDMTDLVRSQDALRDFLKYDSSAAPEEEKSELCWLIPNAQKNSMEPVLLTLEPDGQTYPDNPHEGEEIGYVLEGTVTLVIDKKKYPVKRGESFLIHPDKPHYLMNKGKRPAKLLWVSSPPSF